LTADHSDQRATHIAEALIFAFQSAVLHGEASRDGILLLPTLAPLRTQELCAQLASLPKPITCVAFENPGTLVVGYWTIPPGIDDSFSRRYSDLVRRGRAELALAWHVENPNAPVELTLKSGTVSLSWLDYWTLREDYVTPYLTWIEERPARAVGRDTIVCSVHVRNTAGMWLTATQHKGRARRGLHWRFWA